MVSDHEHNWGQLGPGGCHALRACGLPSDHEPGGCHALGPVHERVSRAWIRGLPWSPTMSAMGPDGCRAVRVRGGASAISAGVTRSGFMVSRGPIMGLAGVTRPGSVIFNVSDHERQGLGGCRAWVRGFPWSPIMSAVGLGGCHAVRVRGFPWTPIMSNKLGRVSRAGFAVSRLLPS